MNKLARKITLVICVSDADAVNEEDAKNALIAGLAEMSISGLHTKVRSVKATSVVEYNKDDIEAAQPGLFDKEFDEEQKIQAV